VASSKVISAADGRPLAPDLSPDEAVGVLRSLVANVPGAIYRVALADDLSLKLIGDEIERITGYPADDFVDASARTLFSLVHPDDRQWVEVELRAARRAALADQHADAAARRPLTIEYRIVRADGAVRWVLERATTVLDQRGRPCLDGVIFDVTERREAEQRLRRQEAEAAQAREVRASRTRIVEAADAARRRLERDLHDGAQQRFVSAALMAQLARRRVAGAGDDDVVGLLDQLIAELQTGLSDLRELAHGIHPAVLTDLGLEKALESLTARAPLPVTVEGALAERPPAPVETALYFTAAEALTNVAKYANASEVVLRVSDEGDEVAIAIRDDGRGGASLDAGSGLRGLVDRLGALGGRLELSSPPGGGTTVRAIVPRDPRADADDDAGAIAGAGGGPGQAAAGSGSGRPGVAASSALRA
jgi:PAS domain S-box-containing protein